VSLKKLEIKDIEPCGYNVLVELLDVKDTSEGGIIMSSEYVNKEQSAMVICKVLKFGPACFLNHDSGINSPEAWGISVGDYAQIPGHAYQRVAGEKSNMVYVLDHDIKAKVNI